MTGVVAWAGLTIHCGQEGKPLARLEGFRAGLEQSGCLLCPTVATDMDILVAGTSGSGPSQLEIADVIICQRRQEICGPATILRRYPGCLVAVAGLNSGTCLVTTLLGPLVTLAITEDGADRRPRGLGRDLRALLCAAFVYGWIAAGQQVSALDGTRLHLAECVPATGWRELAHGGQLSLSLTASLGPVMESADTCNRSTSAASGAPRSV